MHKCTSRERSRLVSAPGARLDSEDRLVQMSCISEKSSWVDTVVLVGVRGGVSEDEVAPAKSIELCEPFVIDLLADLVFE